MGKKKRIGLSLLLNQRQGGIYMDSHANQGLSIVTLDEVKGLGMAGVNAPPQMLRRCGWLTTTSSEQ